MIFIIYCGCSHMMFSEKCATIFSSKLANKDFKVNVYTLDTRQTDRCFEWFLKLESKMRMQSILPPAANLLLDYY